jgi:HD domain
VDRHGVFGHRHAAFIHRLATPGIILPANGLVQVAGALNLPIGGAILAASGLLSASSMPDGAWWMAHLLELGGIGMVGIPAAPDLRHAVASRPLVGDLRAGELVQHEEAFLGGRLTDEEFAEIRRHPTAGRELLSELGGFPPLALDLVESHHERSTARAIPTAPRRANSTSRSAS